MNRSIWNSVALQKELQFALTSKKSFYKVVGNRKNNELIIDGHVCFLGDIENDFEEEVRYESIYNLYQALKNIPESPIVIEFRNFIKIHEAIL